MKDGGRVRLTVIRNLRCADRRNGRRVVGGEGDPEARQGDRARDQLILRPQGYVDRPVRPACFAVLPSAVQRVDDPDPVGG